LLPIIKAKKIYAIANINMFNVFFYKAGKHSPCFEPALFHPVFSSIRSFLSFSLFLHPAVSSGRGNFSVNNFFFSWKIKKPVLKKNKL
jgi:hypothetical protein